MGPFPNDPIILPSSELCLWLSKQWTEATIRLLKSAFTNKPSLRTAKKFEELQLATFTVTSEYEWTDPEGLF